MNWIKIIKENNFHFKKSLGQNFLIDNNIIDKITSSVKENIEGIIEIGPGIGCLTDVFLKSEKIKKIVVIELDDNAVEILMNNYGKYIERKKLIIIKKDILKVDINELILKYFENINQISIVSNLPYNISSPFLFKLFKTDNLKIKTCLLMFQSELAQRIISSINSKQYNNLSVVSQFYFDIKKICDVKKNSFYPVPKVESTVLEFKKNKKYVLTDEEKFLFFVRQMFFSKRKTVWNNLKKYSKNNVKTLEKKISNDIKNKRPENLALSDFYNIYLEILNNEN
ncbi:16S rRNA (adenine(1518)-N(6)/adenine(1519)-N(6))-dimethyltransferase RsmA [Spiroplasma endosymbiont of Amphibalanus improvisus]|uniref:16S rRNA (adenine(1518)-N(6)/adenine(1519)-N(6))- dimethyltransferase RsmA n=1 Tax=Spiroplasma endosymbiont of Amphibalanus improvisus TaxID=3066327 RepID=UPI00313D8B99